MNDTTNSGCRILFDLLTARGLRDVVASPGSRNTPLLVAASVRENLDVRMVTDERAAAFMALGIAMVTRKPAMLICTSGTAMYNYAPAVAEAFYQHVPLIVVTADRPRRWIDQDDSQTLIQPSALEKIVKGSFDIPLDEGAKSPCANPLFDSEREWMVNRTVNTAWNLAMESVPGPVHINFPLDNPLGEMMDITPDLATTVRIIDMPATLRLLPKPEIERLASFLADKKVLLTAGFLPPSDALQKALTAFELLPNVAIAAEPLSNLHFPEFHYCYMVDSLLARASEDTLWELRPDVVISIGGALVSRMLKDFVRKSSPAEIWTLGATDPGVDCFQGLTRHIDADAAPLLRAIARISMSYPFSSRFKSMPEYGSLWRRHREQAAQRNRKNILQAPWSELTAFSTLLAHLPKQYNVYLSNGTPVRYASLLMDTLPHACYGSRGVSGIEGTSATALGTALAYGGPTLLISGDMSFAYYPNILGNPYIPDDFKIIVINNSGGGIFRFIGTTRKLPQREEYFCVPQEIPLPGLASAYGWTYFRADSEQRLQSQLPAFFGTPRAILEIVVDPQTSADTLINFLQHDQE